MKSAALVLLLGSAAIADVAFREACTYESLFKRPPFERRTFFSPGKMRVEETDDGMVMIVRFDKGLEWVMSPKDPRVMEFPLKAAAAAGAADVAAQKKKALDTKARLEKEIAALEKKLKETKDAKLKPPIEEDLAALKHRLENVETAISVGKPIAWCRATAEKATILQHPCVKYNVYVNGDLVQEAWVSDEFKGVEEYRSLVASTYKDFDPGDGASAMEKALLAETKGMRLRKRVLEERGGEPGESGKSPMDVWLVSEVTELVFTPVAASQFELPPGARK